MGCFCLSLVVLFGLVFFGFVLFCFFLLLLIVRQLQSSNPRTIESCIRIWLGALRCPGCGSPSAPSSPSLKWRASYLSEAVMNGLHLRLLRSFCPFSRFGWLWGLWFLPAFHVLSQPHLGMGRTGEFTQLAGAGE